MALPNLTSGLSSGDFLADRRAEYAEMLAEAGDFSAAAELMRETLNLAPNWAAGWFRLGELWQETGDAEMATKAWEETLRLEPGDRFGVQLKLALLRVIPVPDKPPVDFVEALFDDYADRFDKSLVEKLDYRVPELLERAILSTQDNRFAHAVDLGCGTGLMGERLRPICAQLEGIDLSAEMLRKAKARNVYDRLIKGDIEEADLASGIDLVTAADVFMYVGTLEIIFARLATVLEPNGLFAFSVEVSEGEDLTLRDSRRYAHSQAYVERELATAGFAAISLERAAIRTDRGTPIEGLVVVARHQ